MVEIITKEEFKEVSKDYPELVQIYQKVHISPALKLAEKFNEDMEVEVEKVINDEIYDKRQKAVQIGRTLDERSDAYLSKIENDIEERTETIEDIKDFIEEEIEEIERKVGRGFKKKEFEAEVVLRQIKSSLSLAKNKEEVINIAKTIGERAEKNSLKAQVLANNIYVFVDRAKELIQDEKELFFIQSSLEQILKRVEELVYPSSYLILRKMRSNISNFDSGSTGGKRLIKNMVQKYRREMERLEKEYEYEQFVEIHKKVHGY